jgi:hypothetical protein
VRIFLLTVGLLALHTAAFAQVDPGKVFTGPEGLVVQVVPLSGAPKALIEVSGSGSEIDGKVIPHEVEEDHDDRATYQMRLHGRPYNTLYRRAGQLRLNVPGRGTDFLLVYSDEKTRALKSELLLQRYQEEQKSGWLAAFERFDRKKEQALSQKSVDEVVQSFQKSCGSKAPFSIDWSTIDDDILMHLSMSSYCGAPLEALDSLCKDSSSATEAIAKVQAISCRFGRALDLQLSAGTLTWTTSKDGANQERFASTQLLELLLPRSSNAPAVPWGAGQSLPERMTIEKTRVCADDHTHVVVVAPHPEKIHQLFYGDRKQLVRVPLPEGSVSGDDFLDPRFFRKGSSASFRGLDMRVYSSITIDETQRSCTLRCGENQHALKWMGPAEVRELLLSVAVAPSPQKYRPYALLRDERGNYYYVDHGFGPGEDRRFRLFLGPKGALREQKMTNVVSDSEGDIFSTKTGSLRLIIDKSAPATWIQSGRRVPLKAVPVTDNLTMIYNELGVYLGQKLGTPCDDF